MSRPLSMPLASRPQALGKVFFVECWSGDNDNNGIDPATPFNTITYALTQTVAKRNDYIICLETWQQEPAWPIEFTAANDWVHILGLTNPGMPTAYMCPDIDEPTFLLAGTVDTVEIAGFNLGGGVTHGCIEVDSSQRNWIHHCWFGLSDQGLGTPLRGIDVPTGPSGFLVVEDCVFIGDNCDCQGGISENGFDQAGGGAWMTIQRNRFLGCTIGYHSVGGGVNMILDNRFVCPDVAGAAIDLGPHANCKGNMIDGNVAMEGAETVMAANPFRDNNAGDINHWGRNYCTLAGGVEMLLKPA